MKRLVRFAQLSSHHQASLAALFEALVENGDGTHFFPHPLTATEADRLCNRAGLDEYIVLIEDGVVIGYGMLRGWDDGFDVPSLGFATHPQHRRKGVADAMVRELIQRAKVRGAMKLRLTVDANRHHVIDLTSRHGFTFSPLKHDRLLGMLNLLPEEGRKRPRVGIWVAGYVNWGGGIDLMVNHLRAMKAAEPDALISVLVQGPAPSVVTGFRRALRTATLRKIMKLAGRARRQSPVPSRHSERVSELIRQMRAIDHTLEVQFNCGPHDLAAVAELLRLDVLYMAITTPQPRPDCALIGYVADFQHRYLPHLFSTDELERRHKDYDALITASDIMISTSRATTEDMIRFNPNATSKVHELPYSPNLDPDWLQRRPSAISEYGIVEPYFIVCNQFWMHKDHLTVFRAMAEIAASHPEVTLVCTGHTIDYRDRQYFGRLMLESESLGIRQRLRVLGHIPKRDQIELLKRAVSLIQGTRFEGGPGGGATSEAIALGQRVLISEIPINREIQEGDLRFFPPGDHVALAQLMSDALSEVPRSPDPAYLTDLSEVRLRRYGESIWVAIHAAVASREAALRVSGAPGGTRTHDL
jgi:GNAT superfamily N-acetyltransferase